MYREWWFHTYFFGVNPFLKKYIADGVDYVGYARRTGGSPRHNRVGRASLLLNRRVQPVRGCHSVYGRGLSFFFL